MIIGAVDVVPLLIRTWPLFLGLAIYIGIGYLWGKQRQKAMKNNRAMDSYSNATSRTLRFIFSEDRKPVTSMKEKIDKETDEPVSYSYFKQARFTYLATFLASLVVLGFYAGGAFDKWAYTFILPFLLVVTIASRARKVFSERHRMLVRMFEVADSEFRYQKGSAVNPWSKVQIQKWDSDSVPGETVVHFPASWRADDPVKRESFERHFNSTVTDENSWTYEWENSKGFVRCKPVSHLPKNAPYPGSGDQPWNKIPVGEGAEGAVCWDVTQAPHMLVCGPTGTGKSVLQRNIFFHLVQHSDRWSFIGIDPKRVELKPYAKYTDTVLGIGTNLEDGVELVRFADNLMNERYQMMEDMGENNFMDLPDPPKAIFIMVDETFMFLSPSGVKSDEGKEMDELKAEAAVLLGNIARLGRASGVHLLLATQRPDATVIKGELKNNLDARIACGRMDQTPSMMVLDSIGATLLPPIRGRGVFRQNSQEEQFQGYFAPQSWIDEWIQKKKRKSAPQEEENIFESEVEVVQDEPSEETEPVEKPKKKKGKGIMGKLNELNERAEARFEEEDNKTPDEEPPPVKKKAVKKPSKKAPVEPVEEVDEEIDGEEYGEPEESNKSSHKRPKPLDTIDEDDFSDDADMFIEPQKSKPKQTVPPQKSDSDEDEWEDPFSFN